MIGWAKCTNTNGNTVFVNVTNAMSIFRSEIEGLTLIAFAGGPEDVVRVKEEPVAVLEMAGPERPVI